MEKQERKSESRKDPQSKEDVKPNPKVVESGKKLKEEIDKLWTRSTTSSKRTPKSS